MSGSPDRGTCAIATYVRNGNGLVVVAAQIFEQVLDENGALGDLALNSHILAIGRGKLHELGGIGGCGSHVVEFVLGGISGVVVEAVVVNCDGGQSSVGVECRGSAEEGLYSTERAFDNYGLR